MKKTNSLIIMMSIILFSNLNSQRNYPLRITNSDGTTTIIEKQNKATLRTKKRIRTGNPDIKAHLFSLEEVTRDIGANKNRPMVIKIKNKSPFETIVIQPPSYLISNHNEKTALRGIKALRRSSGALITGIGSFLISTTIAVQTHSNAKVSVGLIGSFLLLGYFFISEKVGKIIHDTMRFTNISKVLRSIKNYGAQNEINLGEIEETIEIKPGSTYMDVFFVSKKEKSILYRRGFTPTLKYKVKKLTFNLLV